jgi:glutaminyl-peptide cyclotransferase
MCHRHLAKKWASTYVNPNTKRRLLSSVATEISTIEHLILLDLLGAPHPLIHSFFKETAWLFDAMASVERRLGDSGAFKDEDDWQSFFKPRTGSEYGGFIEDDHIPFLREGVDVLHVIASPFPRVWHSLQVNIESITQ